MHCDKTDEQTVRQEVCYDVCGENLLTHNRDRPGCEDEEVVCALSLFWWLSKQQRGQLGRDLCCEVIP